MRRIETSKLVPGMITAEDVYNYNNQMILPKGLVLNDKAITKLAFYSIVSIRIEDTIENAAPVPFENEVSYFDKVKESKEFKEFKKNFDIEINTFRSTVNDVVEKNIPLDIDSLLADTLSLIHSQDGNVNVFDMLHNMRMYDDLTFVHCMNVALICNVFAKWLKFSEEDTNLATLCGLLHDVGKLMIPESIIRKPDKLTDEEYNIVKTHPKRGYQILMRSPINNHIRNAALMHHEKCDGSGYPYGLLGDQIDEFAKIVSIADVYDAMTSARIYRGPMCPFKVISIFESEGLQKYDAKYILTFLEHIVNTYILNRVRLNDGTEGNIIFINKNHLSRPTIKCGNKYIDLSQEKHLSIDAII